MFLRRWYWLCLQGLSIFSCTYIVLNFTGRGCIKQDRAGAWVQVLAMLGSIKGKKALELGAGIGRFTGSLAAGG